MEKKVIHRLLILSSVALVFAALIFMVFSLVNVNEFNDVIPFALFLALLSLIFNIVRVNLGE